MCMTQMKLWKYFKWKRNQGSKKTVNFDHHNKDMPSCTCKDWQRFHLPCKHFFAIFQHRANWQWEQLPQPYLQSAYLSADCDVLTKHFRASSEVAHEQQLQQSSEVSESDGQLSPEGAHEPQVPVLDSREGTITDDLPKQVTMTIISYMYIRYPTINITILFTGTGSQYLP